jgi:hypothetical protein
MKEDREVWGDIEEVNYDSIKKKIERNCKDICRELRATDPSSLPFGMHWIDPDGQGVGDDSIFVYCNMTSGIKSSNFSLFK